MRNPPTLGDKLLSNFSRGRGGAMGRGSFHAKFLVLFIKNDRLPFQLIKKNTEKLALLVACNWFKKINHYTTKTFFRE